MADGYCEVDFGDASDEADSVEFYSDRAVTARKPHVCCECGGPIAVGERHKLRAYKFDGEFHSERVCPPCQEAAGEFDYRLCGGSLWCMFAEEWDNGAHVQGCINRLETARAKEHMRQQFLKYEQRRADQRRRLRELRASRGEGRPHV